MTAELLGVEEPLTSLPLRLAFYLPQYHPNPENDAWHEPGFTEWNSVSKSRPLFDGHVQPDLPGELGFYDLRVPETRWQQAELARAHGISGFCYYHYWFGGRRMLERVFSEVLDSGVPSFPFCLAWANESWYRRWYGAAGEMVIKQVYSLEDDRAHIRWLIDVFRDPRYIRIDGRPLLCIYRPHLLPDPAGTFEIWSEECEREGERMPWLVGFETQSPPFDPRAAGFDASAEFFPHGLHEVMNDGNIDGVMHGDNEVVDYEAAAKAYTSRPEVEWIRYPCVPTSWDNSPRRQNGGALIMADSTGSAYQEWLNRALRTQLASQGSNGIIFINAWNEWAEGAHLEPSRNMGRAYLEATKQSCEQLGWSPAPAESLPPSEMHPARSAEQLYGELYAKLVEAQAKLSAVVGTVDRQAQKVQRDHEVVVARLRDQLDLLCERNRLLERQLDEAVRISSFGHAGSRIAPIVPSGRSSLMKAVVPTQP